MLPVQFRPDSESVRKCLNRQQRNVLFVFRGIKCVLAGDVVLLYCAR